MTDKIQPALTAEEWAFELEDGTIAETVRLACGEPIPMNSNDTYSPHQIAALALHGQPFGFTREHVTLLDYLAHDCSGPMSRQVDALIEIIEALLPPEARP